MESDLEFSLAWQNNLLRAIDEGKTGKKCIYLLREICYYSRGNVIKLIANCQKWLDSFLRSNHFL